VRTAGVFQAKRYGYGLDIKGFWLRVKYRIIAVLETFAMINSNPNSLGVPRASSPIA
jgi:hypothetical protein